ADRQPLRLLRHQGRDDRRGTRLHLVLAPPRVRLREPDRVEAVLVERSRCRDHLAHRLHRELHHADAKRDAQLVPPAASATCLSSAVRTLFTCWLTIGCRTRWPIEPTGPAIRTSASHFMSVPPPLSLSVNAVSMFMIAPTPLPWACSFVNSGRLFLNFV